MRVVEALTGCGDGSGYVDTGRLCTCCIGWQLMDVGVLIILGIGYRYWCCVFMDSLVGLATVWQSRLSYTS